MEGQDGYVFDIGKIIEPIFRQWRLLIGTTLVCAIVAAVYTIRQPENFTAQVLVASTNIAANVSLGSGIEALTEEQQGYRSGGSTERLNSYVQMVKNPIIAQAVIDDLGDQLPVNLRNVPNLISTVRGNIAGKSDSIEILVSNRSPETAKEIANAWGIAFVDLVNSIYSSDVSRESFKVIQRQKDEAWQVYIEAQNELESFISDNQIDELNRQIADRESLINNLSAARRITASSIISNTIAAKLTVSSEHLADLKNRLIGAYQDSRRVEQLLGDAADMRAQVDIGGDAAARSNSLALTLLKVQVFTVVEEDMTRYQIQISPAEISAEDMLADLDGLTATLESRLDELDLEVETLSNQILDLNNQRTNLSQVPTDTGDHSLSGDRDALGNLLDLSSLEGLVSANTPLSEQITGLEEELNLLQAQAASEADREQELIRARDLAWTTYSALATNEAELRISTDPLGAEVILAVPASTPKASKSDLMQNIVFGALAGFLVGIAIAYVVEFWWRYHDQTPRPLKLFGL